MLKCMKNDGKKKNTKGFTLVEAIVTMVVLAVLASVSAAGMISWQHNAQFRKANEYARSLFTAAQTYLTGAKAGGGLGEISACLGDEDLVTDRNVLEDNEIGRVYFLTWTPQDYEKLTENSFDKSKLEDPKKQAFYQIFQDYLYDKSILDAAICLEFDPADGVVKSVLYDAHAPKMSYGGESGSVDMSKREESDRKKVLLGLYNTELGDRSPNSEGAPQILTVELKNSDTLDLQFRLKNGLNINHYVYDVEILDSTKWSNTVASFSINGSEESKIQALQGNDNKKLFVTTKVNRYTYEGGNQKLDSEIPDCQIRAYATSDQLICVTLDAVDLKAAEILKLLKEEKKDTSNEWLTQNCDRFNNTYSILRFGNLFAIDDTLENGTNKNQMGTISVRVKARGVKEGNWKRSNEESPLIKIPAAGNKTYNIENARHFFNLRFMEAGFESYKWTNSVEYQLTKNFAWSGEGGILESQKVFRGRDQEESIGSNEIMVNPVPEDTNLDIKIFSQETDQDLKDAESEILKACAFPAFTALGENRTLKGDDGKKKTVKGLYVIPEKNMEEITGMDGSISYQFGNAFQDGLGLFLENKGTIQDIVFDDLHVVGQWRERDEYGTVKKDEHDKETWRGIDYVGGVCAKNSGTMKDITVANGLISGHRYVGGLFSGIETKPAPKGSDNSINSNSRRPSLNSLPYVAGAWELFSLKTELSPQTETGENLENGGTPSVSPTETPAPERPGTAINLVNKAVVKGHSYVGGIAGYVKKQDPTQDAKIENCQNKGQVTGDSNCKPKSESQPDPTSRYIGGIVGHNEKGNISGCTSAPSLTQELKGKKQEEINNIITPLLVGDYVGGIVGYNQEGYISGCSTTGGILVGDNYVGGIVGYNQGSIDGTQAGNQGENKAHVIGNKYVGGIVGANAPIEEETTGSGYFVPRDATNEEKNKYTVENWKNRGLVAARKEYGGGITGYNAGQLIGCDCSIDVSSQKGLDLLALLKKYMNEKISDEKFTVCGDYIGGFAGYNSGLISGSPSGGKVVSIVSGDRFVGGMVGYNAKGGDVENYDLTGGYISGNSFVGGFAGLNGSVNLFQSSEDGKPKQAVSSPNLVEGNYFVGGMVGGNLLPMSENVFIQIHTNNFLGSIKARDEDKGVFVGGLLGYNANLLYSVNDSDIKKMAEDMAGRMEGEMPETLSEKISSVSDYITDDVKANSELTLTIGSQDNDEYGDIIQKDNKLSKIQGYVHVGGAVGYNHASSKMRIQNIVNKIPIIADGSVKDKTYGVLKNGQEKQYAYAGGIIGLVTQNTTVDNCKNDGQGRVNANKATYHGSLVEVNEGTIENCTVTTVGSHSQNHVGGLVGLNGFVFVKEGNPPKQGTIKSCKIGSDATVLGEDCVGGIAGENYGTITEISFENGSRVNGQGDYVGGIAGLNSDGTSLISPVSVAGEITEVKMANAQITGTGTYVGGVVGGNKGKITNITPHESSRVSGKDSVGGVIGRALGGTWKVEEISSGNRILGKDLTNYGSVTAKTGSAGGVIGTVEESLGKDCIILSCENQGSVEAQEKAGGIVSNNGFNQDDSEIVSGEESEAKIGITIQNCKNHGDVTSKRGEVGGITAVNAGTITGCTVAGPKENGKVIELKLTSYGDVGGITAYNTGHISGATLSNLHISNQKLSKPSNIGGAAGVNDKTGTIKNVTFTDGTVMSYTATQLEGGVGGLVGKNTGAIQAEAEKNTVTNVTLKFSENGLNGNLGGIAGYNQGTVSGCKFTDGIDNGNVQPLIDGNGGSAFGYGGIVGINAGTVETCSFKGGIQAKGDQSDIVSIGGIAGKNHTEGSVQECKILNGSKITADTAYIGGAVGTNHGKVQKINDSYRTKSKGTVEIADHQAQVLVQTQKGHIGGIIGLNETEGSLSYSSTGENWKIQATGSATDNAAGGAIGYNTSGKALRYVQNLGYVIKDVDNSNSVGGLVGRWENSQVQAFTIQSCVNRGLVEGRARLGGLVGQVKYTGFTVKDCENYGEVKKVKTDTDIASGGLVGYMYETVSGQTVSFISCKNFGDITWNPASNYYVGGIFGGCNNSIRGVEFSFTDCVNAGDITANSIYKDVNIGGINGNLNDQKATYNKCRNYGTVKDDNIEKFCGITPDKNATLTDCYGVTVARREEVEGAEKVWKQSYTPLGPAANTSVNINSHYFWRQLEQGEDAPNGVKAYSVHDRDGNSLENMIEVSHSFSNAFDGNETTRWNLHSKDGKGNRKNINVALPTISITPYHGKVDDIEIKWYSTSDKRYQFKLSYVDDNNNEHFIENYTYDTNVNTQDKIKMKVKNKNECYSKWKQTLNLKNNNVKQILLTVTSVQDCSTNAEREYLSIWDISLNTNTQLDSLSNLGQELYLYEARQDEEGMPIYTAVNSQKVIENLPYDPNDPNVTNKTSKDKYNEIDHLLYVSDSGGDSGFVPPSSGQEPLPTPEDVFMELDLTQTQEKFTASWKKLLDLVGDEKAWTQVVLEILDKDKKPVVNENGEPVKIKGEESASTGSIVINNQLSEYIGKGYFARASIQHLAQEGSAHYTNSPVYVWTPDFSLDAEETLPIPKFHFEITSTDPIKYQLIWDNKEKYQNRDTLVVEGVANTLLNISKEESQTEVLPDTTKNESRNVIAYVKRGGNGTEPAQFSPKVAYQTQLYNEARLKEGMAAFKGSSFYGPTPDTLYQKSTLTGMEESFYRTDLMVWDEAVGRLVSVASTTARVPKGGSVTMLLEKLPQKEGNSLLEYCAKTYTERGQQSMVYAYPWRSQNDVVYYTKVHESNLSAGQVTEKLNTPPGSGEQYIVEKTGADTYQILQTFCQIQNKPVDVKASATMEIAEEYKIENGNYIFEWDKENSQTGSTYEVILTGKRQEDDSEVVLYHEKEYKDKYVIIPSENYPNLTLTVTRYGQTDSDGSLKTYGTRKSQNYSVKIPLRAIAAPIVELDEDKGKDELFYKISWDGLQENDSQYSYLQGYQVWAKMGGELEDVKLGDAGCDGRNITVDFDNYQGKNLQIYVKAIADNTIYTDSHGLTVNFQVPKRMDTPELENISLTRKNEEDLPKVVTKQELMEEGFLLKVKGQSDNDTCIFQACFVESISPEPTINWEDLEHHSDPYEYGNKVSMNGSSYYIQIDEKYAGWHLAVRVRATSDNEISSAWSDAAFFLLPKMYLETPELEPDEEVPKVSQIDSVKISVSNDVDDVKDVKRTTLSWQHDPLAWGYEVEVMPLWKQDEIADGTNPRTPYSFYLYQNSENNWMLRLPKIEAVKNGATEEVDLVRKEAKYEEDGNGDIRAEENLDFTDDPNPEEEPKWYYLFENGTVPDTPSSGDSWKLGHEDEITGNVFLHETEQPITYQAKLGLEIYENNEGISFCLILPDGKWEDYDFQGTQYVAVKALSQDPILGEDTQYAASQEYCQWIRIWDYMNYTKPGMTSFITRKVAEEDKFLEDENLDLPSNWIIQDRKLVVAKDLTGTATIDPQNVALEEMFSDSGEGDAVNMIPVPDEDFTSGESEVLEMIPQEITDPWIKEAGTNGTEEAVDYETE